MATSSANTIYTNTYIPEYVVCFRQLEMVRKRRLRYLYKKNKCDEFLEDTDRYFHIMQIINFDIIQNQKTITKNKLEQYQTVSYDAIKKYPSVEQA